MRTPIMALFLCSYLLLPSFTEEMLASIGAEQNVSGVQQSSFVLPHHGTLILNVPDTWKQIVRQPPGDLPPTITFSPDKGDEFKVLITPIWSPKKDIAFNKSEKIKSLIENDLRGLLTRTVEHQVDIREFQGVYGVGYYFLVTDKAPKVGEYPYAIRAGVGIGDLLLSVTVLSRSKNSEGITSTIKALQKAKQVYE